MRDSCSGGSSWAPSPIACASARSPSRALATASYSAWSAGFADSPPVGTCKPAHDSVLSSHAKCTSGVTVDYTAQSCNQHAGFLMPCFACLSGAAQDVQ